MANTSKRPQRAKTVKLDIGTCIRLKKAAVAVLMRTRGIQWRGEDGNILWATTRTEFPKDFPRARVREKSENFTTYKLNAVSLLNWLHKHGYSDFDSAGFIAMTKRFEYFEKGIDKLIEEI
jgi:hypothetical protein